MCLASRRRCFRIPLSPLPSLFAFFASCAFGCSAIFFGPAFPFLPVTYSFSLLCCFLGLVCLLADLLVQGFTAPLLEDPLSPLPSLFAFFASCAFGSSAIFFRPAFPFLPVTYSFSLLCCFLGLVCLADLLPLGPALGLEDLLVQGFTAPLLEDPVSPLPSLFAFFASCAFGSSAIFFRPAFPFLPVTYSFSLLCCFLGLVCLADLLPLGPALGLEDLLVQGFTAPLLEDPLSPLPSLFAFFASCAFGSSAIFFRPAFPSFSLLCCFLGLVCLADLLPLGPALGLEDLLVQGFTAPLLEDPVSPLPSLFAFFASCAFGSSAIFFRPAFPFLPVSYSFSLLCCFLGLVCLWRSAILGQLFGISFCAVWLHGAVLMDFFEASIFPLPCG